MKYARNRSLAGEMSSLRSIEYAKGQTIASAHQKRSRGAVNHNVGLEFTGAYRARQSPTSKKPRNREQTACEPNAGFAREAGGGRPEAVGGVTTESPCTMRARRTNVT